MPQIRIGNADKPEGLTDWHFFSKYKFCKAIKIIPVLTAIPYLKPLQLNRKQITDLHKLK